MGFFSKPVLTKKRRKTLDSFLANAVKALKELKKSARSRIVKDMYELMLKNVANTPIYFYPSRLLRANFFSFGGRTGMSVTKGENVSLYKIIQIGGWRKIVRESFINLPAEHIFSGDKMTLDGILWVEGGVPYMVFCHEWVQICNGTIEYIQLKDDLSETVGEPKKMFHATSAPWPKSGGLGNTVTDGPYLYTGKTGKLYMVWSSFTETGYTEGIAISDFGKLAGPWRHQAEPLIATNAGHGMLFTTFDGRLMNVLHSPNDRRAQPKIFEMEDTGETLRIVREFTGK